MKGQIGANNKSKVKHLSIVAGSTLEMLPEQDRQESPNLITKKLGFSESKDWRA